MLTPLPPVFNVYTRKERRHYCRMFCCNAFVRYNFIFCTIPECRPCPFDA
ncbi:hypothetical protein HMPREF2738_02780 [Clostridiales bacterium KLE1615]|nr:hypothetical protein HMPREF2738_02780 [Clostridiales bacterium KLE1615]